MPDNKQTDETGSRQKLTDSDIAPSSTNRLFFDGIDSGTNGLFPGLYSYNDIDIILGIKPSGTITSRIYDLDRLLEKDKLREKDGFPRKIKLGKLIKPAKDGTDKTIIIPSTNEEKFYHWMSESEAGEGQSTGGSGEGDEGEVIGESPLRPDDEGDGTGAGKGGSGDHGMGADAYEV
ncbi:MAG: hypothetical protein HY965_08180, partial [Ignavibacteriales bacterium]|nr:hypothetical protein [Ignavibacteriales bacterium]